ncbi:MAG: ferrous iron transport protein A [bacterium]|nr:ferrous iron transport protein A [bacterium]
MVAPNLQDELSLSGLETGQAGVVRGLRATGLVRRRLLDLGFCPGTVIDVVRSSPLGDPICYRLRGSAVALRRQDAADVLLEPRDGRADRKTA